MKSIGITVIYFNDENKNIYAKIPPDKELAKRLSKRIYKDAMTALSVEKPNFQPQNQPCG